jgi:hypothetical protein
VKRAPGRADATELFALEQRAGRVDDLLKVFGALVGSRASRTSAMRSSGYLDKLYDDGHQITTKMMIVI